MTSIHLRRLQSRASRTADRLVDHANRNGLAVADLQGVQLPWYEIRNEAGDAPEGGEEPGVASVLIYDEIGGSFGVDASQFARDLEAITAPQIRVRINSPGGSAIDAIAIYNSLNTHPARVVVQVDSMAASAASVIAMSGDEIVMMPGSQMMIHDASLLFDGNADDMSKMATFLDRQSDNIADLYLLKGGGDRPEWRGLMKAETWMFAAEAVEMGLADRVEEVRQAVDEPGPDEPMDRRFDLSGFRYAGRERAPTPRRREGRSTLVTAARRSVAPQPDEPVAERETHFTRAYTEAGRNLADEPMGSPIPFVASTPGVKRDGLDLRANGWRIDNYVRNPVVLWAHNHTAPSIGRAEARADRDQLHTDVVFDQEDPFAVKIESKYRRGFLSAVSVGWDFVDTNGTPIPWSRLSVADVRDKVFYDLTELSGVPVPSDPEALVARQRAALRHISRELTDLFDDMEHPDSDVTAPMVQQALLDECVRLGIPLDLEHWQPVDLTRAAIPPHTTPKDDNRGAPWDANAERRQAEGRAQLRRMHAWVDGDGDPEAKGSYKLPHHRADGTLVWRGLTAAMSRLNQSGTDIDDRPGTHAHLARHYRQFGEEPPPLRQLADHDHPPASAGVDQHAARTILAAFDIDRSRT